MTALILEIVYSTTRAYSSQREPPIVSGLRVTAIAIVD